LWQLVPDNACKVNGSLVVLFVWQAESEYMSTVKAVVSATTPTHTHTRMKTTATFKEVIASFGMQRAA